MYFAKSRWRRNAADAKQLYERAESQGVRHMTYFTNRWLPHHRYLHDLVAQGTVGRLYHIQLNFMSGFALSPHYAWRYDPQRATGVIGDLGSHMIDMARYLVGDIARVNARLVTNVQRNGADGQPMTSACDAATVWVEFVDGSQGTIEVNSVARTHDPAFEHAVILHGEAGSLTASFGIFSSPPKLEVAQGNEGYHPLAIPENYLQGLDPAQPVGPQMGKLLGQSPNGGCGFVDAILAGQSIAPSFYEGWQVQRVLDAALASHERGGWVAVQ
ncbi:MAG: Gfo/Idh/MocA family oxidoreductase [Caldilineaceae bacterium]